VTFSGMNSTTPPAPEKKANKNAITQYNASTSLGLQNYQHMGPTKEKSQINQQNRSYCCHLLGNITDKSSCNANC